MSVRYRRPALTSPSPSPLKPVRKVADTPAPHPGFSALDILRILGGILLLSSALSYLSTSGESLTWTYNPWWTRAHAWKALLFTRAVHLTDDELRAYDGSDPQKPIYLALNGTIYDVSANPATYGPGGAYHVFAGRDAARAFLTGCFAEDATPDLRDVDHMYLPLDPWERALSPDDDNDHDNDDDNNDEQRAQLAAQVQVARRALERMTNAELKNRHARERREARRRVQEGLEHWHKLFRGDTGKPYFQAGTVKREDGWLEKLPRRELCPRALKQRPIRKYDE